MKKCNICNSDLKLFIESIKDYEYGVDYDTKIMICDNCALITQSKMFSAGDIPELYPDNYLAHSDASGKKDSIYGRLKNILANSTIRSIANLIPNNGCLVEIGCGNCHLLEKLALLRPDVRLIGIDIVDIEPEKKMIPNFTFLHGQFEAFSFTDIDVNLFYFSNLIEHVPDPYLFLSKCLRSLGKNGCIMGITPNHNSLDRVILGKYWAGYHYPRHINVFNHKNIKLCLEKIGFQKIEISGGYSFWYISLRNYIFGRGGDWNRGIMFAVITGLFLPLDKFLNLFWPHGSMTFRAYKQE